MWLNHEFVPVEMSQVTETVVNHCWGGKTRKLTIDPKCLKMSNVIQIHLSVCGQWRAWEKAWLCLRIAINYLICLPSRVALTIESLLNLIVPFHWSPSHQKKIEEDFHSANWQKDLLAVPTQIEGLTRNFQCRLLCPSYPESPLPLYPTQREKTGKSFIYKIQQEQQQT